MKIVKRHGENYENRMNDNYRADIKDLEAKLAYISMMTGVEIPEETRNDNERTDSNLV